MKIVTFILCLLLMQFAAFGSSTDSLENALKTAQGNQKVKVLNELFRSYVNADPVKALGFAKEALTLAMSIDDKRGMAAAYNNLGVAYRNQGALDIALEHYLKSLALYDSIQNQEGTVTTKNNIANIYTLKKDYGQALRYFDESRKGFIEMGATDKIIGSLNNLGNLHSDMQRYEEALHFYEEALSMTEKASHVQPEPLINLGNLYFRKGDYQRAVDYYGQALTLVRKQDDKISEVHLMTSMGEVFLSANMNKEAQKILEEAFKLANALEAFVYLPQIYKTMAANYFRQGKTREAYETLLKYDEAREKVYGEESTRRISQMDMALKLREKESEIELIEADRQMKTLKLHNIEFIITAVVLGLIALVAVGNIYFMGKRRKSAA